MKRKGYVATRMAMSFGQTEVFWLDAMVSAVLRGDRGQFDQLAKAEPFSVIATKFRAMRKGLEKALEKRRNVDAVLAGRGSVEMLTVAERVDYDYLVTKPYARARRTRTHTPRIAPSTLRSKRRSLGEEVRAEFIRLIDSGMSVQRARMTLVNTRRLERKVIRSFTNPVTVDKFRARSVAVQEAAE